MPQHLLLVEDDDAVADVVGLHLGHAGYQFTHVADGRQALARVDAQTFDLVLLDLMLPGASGWDICRHLRRKPNHVPIIMLSARSDEAERVLGLELGADDYLVKPFSTLELVARVRALLRRVGKMAASASADGAVCSLGALQLHLAPREAWLGGRALALTQREFELLHFFARHPGQIFSRGELLQRVWGAGFDGYEHTVNSHINRLRHKLANVQSEVPTAAQIIETVWGMGYRLDPQATALPEAHTCAA
jgi:DNA-binding response OmpR family regulator